MLLLCFRPGDGGRFETPRDEEREALLRVAGEAGGGEYLVGLRRYEGHPRREELLRLKEEVHPEGILPAVS